MWVFLKVREYGCIVLDRGEWFIKNLFIMLFDGFIFKILLLENVCVIGGGIKIRWRFFIRYKIGLLRKVGIKG